MRFSSLPSCSSACKTCGVSTMHAVDPINLSCAQTLSSSWKIRGEKAGASDSRNERVAVSTGSYSASSFAGSAPSPRCPHAPGALSSLTVSSPSFLTTSDAAWMTMVTLPRLHRDSLGTLWTADAHPGILLPNLSSTRRVNGEHCMRTDETRGFWEEKLTENQRILAMLDSGQFKAGDGSVIDAQMLAEVRTCALRRVAECAARIAERRA